MADFKPTKPFFFYDKLGNTLMAVGWFSTSGTWVDIEPLIENPDGPGVKQYSVVFGADPWFIRKPKL